MEQLVAFDSKLRMTIGITPIDPDIRRVGVGGYTGPTLPPQISAPTAAAVQHLDQDVGKLLRETKLQHESFEELEQALKQKQDMWTHLPSIQPTPGWITSGFGSRWTLHRPGQAA